MHADTAIPAVETPRPAVPLRSWLAVTAVAAATFAMVTVESLPVGLLTAIGGGLGVSPGLAGLTVTLPGLLASVSAVVLPVLIRRTDRRLVLLVLLAVMLVATLASGLAPNFAVLLTARFFVGIAIGGFWALAASVAVRLVPEQHIPRATALAFGGATAANVLGAPAATLVGGLTDWRIAFLVVAGLGAFVAAALYALLPQLPATDPIRPRTLAAQLRVPAVRMAVTATFLLVGGHWAAFTFVSPILQQTSGLDERLIGPAQLGFGAAGIAGTFLAGSAAARDPRRVLLGTGALLTAALALFTVAGQTPAGGVALLLVWGLAFGAVPVGVQTWIFRAAPEAAEAATALNTALFNLAIAVGALVGGLVVDGAGTAGVLWTGAALGAVATLAVWAGGRSLTR
ncbi:MFS transporter [Actinomadura kijaniata]|uniref:MFS transporter n=1 Tax=Actinomadura kijaniata TaxID=46161 RepID=UPI00083137C0|nr:MFS transporter [Actinomadura kijaniata]